MTLKRTKRVTALFFPEEWADITRAALAAGLKPGTYIRFKTLEAARKGERLSKGFAMGQEMLKELVEEDE